MSANPGFRELLSRAEAMVPSLRERAPAAELARTVPPATIQELLVARLFDIQKPARFGGFELGMPEFVDIVAALGRGCGSTAWVFGVTAERSWLLAKFAAQAQHDVWDGHPDALITCSITPNGQALRARGGYRVTGAWSFVSGIDCADWCVFCSTVPADEQGPARVIYLLVPRVDCEVIDSWHVAGLAATGSRDVKLHDVFIPEHRTVAMQELKEGRGPGLSYNPAPLFRLPLIALNPYAILAPLLGIAEGALELTLSGARARKMVTTGAAAALQQSVQLRIAEAAAEIAAARALIMSDCREAMQAVESGAAVSVPLRLQIRRNQAFGARLLVTAVDRLFTVAGGRGIYLDHPMQRAFRDAHAAAQHLGLSWDMAGTMWGQHALGLDVTTPAY
jgi:3-hydroxy-9,10-secoandrosta-1,3,5(10)-triene-9,17-dione monooxygenase